MYLDWHHNYTRAHLFRHIYENFTAVKQLNRPYNEQVASQTLKDAQNTLKLINDHWLANSPYVNGLEQVSIADLFLYGEIAQLLLLTDAHEKTVKESSFLHDHDNIKQWMTRIEQLPHYEQVHKLLPIIKSKFRDIPLK